MKLVLRRGQNTSMMRTSKTTPQEPYRYPVPLASWKASHNLTATNTTNFWNKIVCSRASHCCCPRTYRFLRVRRQEDHNGKRRRSLNLFVEKRSRELTSRPSEDSSSRMEVTASNAVEFVRTPKDIQPQKTKKSTVTNIEKAEPGRGGKQHKYLQQLVKQLAEERKFRATIEETILGGEGRVDVSLLHGGYRIACQISVTTTRDWELSNVEKCIAAGYDEVVLVGSTEHQVKALAKFIEENLDEEHQGKIRYAVPESIIEFLDSIKVGPKTTASEVRGYKVKVTRQDLSPEETAKRRAAVAGVIARSLRKGKE